MPATNKRFADQLHAAMSIMESNEDTAADKRDREERAKLERNRKGGAGYDPTDEETTSNPTDELVVEYLSSFFGQDLTESTEDISEDDLLEAVESLNTLCAIVNEYFGLEENMMLAPKKGKGREAAKKMY